MIILKLTNGNVVLEDASGNVVKRFVSDSFIQWTSPTTLDVYANSDKITTLVTTEITATQIQPAAAIPFTGNAYDLLDILVVDFFFKLAGGGGSQNLTQVLTVGNSAGNLDIIDVDKLDFNTSTTDTAGIGQLVWNTTDGTLDLGLQTGHLNKLGTQLVVKARNTSGSAINKGEVVKVVGVIGGNIGIEKAQGDSDANSATAFGIVAENIANNSIGFVAIQGIVHGLDTNAYSEGDILYLSPTTPGALTNVKPVAPLHSVVIGYVAKKNTTDGHILLHVQNGYEIDELHDVNFPSSPVNGNILQYNGSTMVWENNVLKTQVLAQASPNVTHTGNTTNTLVYSKLIPLNTVGTGDALQIATKFTKPSGSAANVTVRLYINTSNSLSGATLLATYVTTNLNGRFFLVERTANVDGATTNFISASSGALTDSATLSTVAPSDVSIDWTVDQYFIVAIQLGNSGDSTTLRLANVILNKAV